MSSRTLISFIRDSARPHLLVIVMSLNGALEENNENKPNHYFQDIIVSRIPVLSL